MSGENMLSLRAQILANAGMLLCPRTTATPANGGTTPPLEIVVYGAKSDFTAIVMQGIHPAISTDPKNGSPEVAMRKLLETTCELLKEYLPKVPEHHRNVAGGGVFDDTLISSALPRQN